jgi:hypothetical protein
VEPEVVSPTPEAARGPALAHIEWLGERDTTTPERWLASRQAKSDLDEKDQEVISMRERLKVAAHRFGDPPRMIANRAVQLEAMLASAGISESAPELIVSLSEISEERPREGFGSLCQHYFNLRKQGLDREAALAQLKSRSGLEARVRGSRA